METKVMAKNAKKASILMTSIVSNTKNTALENIALKLDEKRKYIIEKNKVDLERSIKENLDAPLLKRLKFDDKKIDGVIEGIKSLITLKDPVGETIFSKELDSDLNLYKVSCPIGVIGVIFESRPDALVQISTLCLKSGNSVVLKGGSEAMETNKALYEIISEATVESGIPQGWIQLITTREEVKEMLSLDEMIDLIIPRGSNDFVRYIMDNSRIPVLGHADGICHMYIDKYADINMAVDLALDSKTQYVAVCNALETLLVSRDIANEYLPLLEKELNKKNVEIIGCQKTCKIINAKKASEEDWKTEYLDYTLSIKIVDDVDEAINHINKYGSGHTDAIVTKNIDNAEKFMNLVDSGNVFLNCSTRFSDGFRYGFGAEVGISTNKIHARGPVGLDGLMIYKYKLIGKGQIVDDYASGKSKFVHKETNSKFRL